jgi:cyclophilin family peptidyl-prolyl cis-trans isomerase
VAGAALALLALAALLVACGAGARPTDTPASQAGARVPAGAQPTAGGGAGKQYSAPPAMTIDPNKSYTALIKTSLGDITIDLNARDAPQTVNNFVFLARDGFYNGVTFHRVIKDFVIQTGDPTGTGMGSPGYRFADEPVKGTYEVGAVAMANSGPNTNGSQFFICEGERCKTLDPKYNLFGKVVAGQDVVSKIAGVPKTMGGDGAQSKPAQEVKINTIEIIEQ